VGWRLGVPGWRSWTSYRSWLSSRLSREAPDRLSLASRYLTSLYVRRPGDDRQSSGDLDDQAQGDLPGRS
jgi:hypothetical protein